MKENKEIFVLAVKNHPDIPERIKSCADSVVDLVKTTFKETYFELLDEQIKLGQRGLEWTEILQSRRDALAPYCGKFLLRGLIQYEGKNVNIRVDPKTNSVVHWEEIEKKQPMKKQPMKKM